MSLTKKLVLGSALLSIIGVGGVAYARKDFREYLTKKTVEYLPFISCAAGVLLAESKPSRRMINKIEYVMGRAACGYKD